MDKKYLSDQDSKISKEKEERENEFKKKFFPKLCNIFNILKKNNKNYCNLFLG